MEYAEESTQENNNSRNIQDTRQRKSRYRILLNRVEELQETGSTGLHTATEVGQILTELNQLNVDVNIEERVGNADETLLDCLVLSAASGILKKCIQGVDVFTSTYDDKEFGDLVLADIQSEQEPERPNPWTALLAQARIAIPTAPHLINLYGAYDLNNLPRPKQKKERVKALKEKLQKKEPEKVVNVEKEEEGIEEIVKVLYEVLQEAYVNNDEQPVKYYDYVIDTENFGTTIENMFYFSFLIRDGRAHMELDRRGEPIIKPMKKKDLKEFRAQGGKNAQVISSISMDLWEKFKKPGFLQQRKAQQQQTTSRR